MAEIQIEGLASRDEELLSRKDLEKDLEEGSEGKKRGKSITFGNRPIPILLSPNAFGARPISLRGRQWLIQALHLAKT